MVQKRKKIRHQWINKIIKTLLFLLLSWIIYRQVSSNQGLFIQWKNHLSTNLNGSLWYLILAFLLMPVNISLEAFKWKDLVSKFGEHSFPLAIKSVLAGITAGLITPARLGDYVGKLMFIPPENNLKAIWSNLICAISQNLMNMIGGILGLLFFFSQRIELEKTTFSFFLILSILVSLILILFYFNLHWIPFLLKKLDHIKFLKKLSRSLSVLYRFDNPILYKNLFLSLLRYLVFVTQYFLLLKFWGVDAPILILYSGIATAFLIQSAIPLPPILGILARGEIALLVFGLIGSNSLQVLSSVLSLWTINLAIPALFGFFFVFNIDIRKTMGYGKT